MRTPRVRNRRVRTLEDLLVPNGPPLRARDLAALTGFSKRKILDDIHAGYLKAISAKCGHSSIWLVKVQDAKRYLESLQLL